MYQTARQFVDMRNAHFTGRVLDIGGGGEGVISQLTDAQVVAIDIAKVKLEQSPDVGLKIIMDACNLKFLDDYFENVTCFFSLMYMDEADIRQFLQEAGRVLKKGGKLWIWDAEIPPNPTDDIYCVQLKVQIGNENVITPGYGVRWAKIQSLQSLCKLCEDAGFDILEATQDDLVLKIIAQK